MTVRSGAAALRSPRFETRRVLGQGAYGVVYEAFDRERSARVAVKALTRCAPEALASFKNEFRAIQDLLHPNLVQLHELIEHDGTWLIVMELVEGRDFWQHMRAADLGHADNMNVLPFDEACVRDGLLQLADALEALHRAKLVHRDLKPSNMRFTSQGRLVLLDFGLVTELGRGRAQAEAAAVGSAAYMAPEQANGELGPAADWYAVGAVLYEVLTGRLPFDGSGLDILLAKQRARPERPSTIVPGIPEDLERLCVDLLAADPAERPSAPQVRARLTPAGARTTALPSTMTARFAGRVEELAGLEGALERARDGTACHVIIEGESGVGKTALVEELLRVVADRYEGALVLRGRCFELEAVPFKGVDGIVDALARHVGRMPKQASEPLLPRRAALLPRLFPVLAAVPAIGRAVLRQEPRDPAVLRREAVDALFEFFERIAERALLVLVLDDLQWADEETFRLLEELGRRESTGRMLWLMTSRPPEELEGPARAWVSKVHALPRTVRLSLSGLPPHEASTLASELLGADASPAWVDAVVGAAQGHPLLINELARFVSSGAARSVDALSLEAALAARIDDLGTHTRELLELVALAGRPRALGTFASAMARTPEQLTSCVGALRAARLVSTGQSGRLRCFHDRIRRAVTALIAPDVARTRHRQLASALEALPDGDFHAAVHWHEAGELARALPLYERAAQSALRLFAFERAAGLYETLIAIGRDRIEADHLRALRVQRAGAFAQAGRSLLSARAYLEALDGAPPEEALDLRRHAAQHLLQGAEVREGIEVLTRVAHDLKLGFPKGPKAAFLRLVWHRTLLGLRGLETTPKDASEIAPDVLSRLELLHGLTPGLTWVDLFRGAELGARHLRLSLASGERRHTVMALAAEALLHAIQSKDVPERTFQLLERARMLGSELRDPAPRAFVEVSLGQVKQCQWRVREARAALERAEELYSERPRVDWHQSVARTFLLSLIGLQGEYALHAELLEGWLNEAHARDDQFAHSNYVLMGLGGYRHLLRDRPERARKELEDALALWPEDPVGMPQFGAFFACGAVLSYGSWEEACERSRVDVARLLRTPLAYPRFVRASLHHVHAMACIGGAAQRTGEARKALLREASEHGRLAERVHAPTRMIAPLVHGLVAMLDDAPDVARAHLSSVLVDLERVGAHQWARQARVILACCDGPRARDAALENEARFFEEQGFANVERALAWLYPVAHAAV